MTIPIPDIAHFRGRAQRGRRKAPYLYGDLVHDELRQPFIAYWQDGTRYEVAVSFTQRNTFIKDATGRCVYEGDILLLTVKDIRIVDTITYTDGVWLTEAEGAPLCDYSRIEIIGNEIDDYVETLREQYQENIN